MFSVLLLILGLDIFWKDSLKGSSEYLSKTEDKGKNRQPSQFNSVYLEKYVFEIMQERSFTFLLLRRLVNTNNTTSSFSEKGICIYKTKKNYS